jgi:hypothetical protein
MSDVLRTMVVAAEAAPLARALSAAIPSGAGMFVAAYSPTGREPATHYVNDGWIDEQYALALESPEALVAMIEAQGQVLPLAKAAWLLGSAVISDRRAPEVLAEMGLQPVVPEGV